MSRYEILSLFGFDLMLVIAVRMEVLIKAFGSMLILIKRIDIKRIDIKHTDQKLISKYQMLILNIFDYLKCFSLFLESLSPLCHLSIKQLSLAEVL